MSRRKGRVLAFQGIYSWDVGKNSLEDILGFSWAEEGDAPEEKAFASLIISGTVEHIDEIDKMIRTHLSASWSFDRVNRVSLAILRTSIYEIVFQNSTDMRIVIDEAIEISKKYGEDNSFKFINAILDKISKEQIAEKEQN